MTNIEKLKLLREKTNAGFTECKNALIATNYDYENAIKFLQKKALDDAEKKSFRLTKYAIIGNYIHNNLEFGVLLELRCETDFVGHNIEFLKLAKDLAIQIASDTSIIFINFEKFIINKKHWVFNKNFNTTKFELLKNYIENDLKNYALLNRSLIQDSTLTVKEYIKLYISKLGENIKITNFNIFKVNYINFRNLDYENLS